MFKRILNFLKTTLVVFFLTFLLTLFIDFFFGKLILAKLDPYLSKTDFYGRLIRIDHKFYHHTFKANVRYEKASSFQNYYTLCTDNHGFKYKCNKKREKNFDLAFIGDSFVEGVALNYEKTFVGIFEKEKNISVANLGVSSYSPNIYLSKMKYLLDNNFKFKHVIVFIDISDLYDDNTFYKLNNDLSVSDKNADKKRRKIRKILRNNFPLTNYYFYVIKMMKRLNNKVPPLISLTPIFTEKASLKAKWTYQKEDKIEEYKDLISKTQNEMLSTMSRLHNLLNKNNIKMSLAVYPWPQQIEFDVVNSKHVKMWRDFCKQKCFKFIDFFPYFFDEKDKSSFLEVYKKYYFWNDPHFNAEGNRIIAERLIKEF